MLLNLPVFEILSLLPMGNCSSHSFFQYHMSYADQERYENEERPEVQRQILAEIARRLPVYTRTGSGGGLSSGSVLWSHMLQWPVLAVQMTRLTHRVFLMPLHVLSNSCVNNCKAFSLRFYVWENKKALNASVHLQWSTRCCLWEAICSPLYLPFKCLCVLSAFSNRITKLAAVFTRNGIQVRTAGQNSVGRFLGPIWWSSADCAPFKT